MPAEKVTIKSENRRSNKPLMEKRRRARINQSLTELKNLILDAMKKDTSRSSKLEKADILEMAVRHLQNLQLQKSISVSVTNTSSSSPPPPPSSPEDELDVNRNQKHSKYRAGYNECAKEVSHFLDTVDGIDSAVRERLVAHLLNCLNVISESTAIDKGNKPVVPPVIINAKVDDDDDDSGCYSISMDSEPSSAENTSSSLSPVSSSSVFDNGTLPLPVTSASSVPQPIHIHIPATSIPLSILSNRHPSVISSPATFHGLQLVPTRLSTGEFAFVVPNSHPCSSVSTASANMFSSSSSVPSGSRQPQSSPEPTAEAFPRDVRHSSSCGHSKHNKLFPLVISDEPVWRPW